MNIGIVLYPTFGGSGVVATELGKALAAMGNNVHFITYRQPVRLDRPSRSIFYHEVRVSDYPLFEYQPYEFVLSSKLVDVARFEKLDLLHVHYAIPHASAAYMARQILASEGLKLPYITTLHGTDITLVGRDSSFEPVITFAINESDAVTAVSNDLKEETYKHFKVVKDIQVIPNFVCLDANASPDAQLKSTFAPGGEKVLLHISNFRKVKRVGDVVKVFEKVRKKVPSVLLLVGDGPEKHAVEELCRRSEAGGQVRFIGNIRETDKILGLADLFLLTSEFESFGLAALEAMAYKVPVVSTNKGGIPEVMIDGQTGFMCEVGDINALAERSIEILTDAILFGRLREGAFSRARDFEIGKVLPKYLELYKSILNHESKR